MENRFYKSNSYILTGIIALMDEECLRPGEATDKTLLVKMNDRLSDHKHYFSFETEADNKVCIIRLFS